MIPDEIEKWVTIKFKTYIRKFPHLKHLAEDIKQEAYYAALLAKSRWDPSKGASLSTFLNFYIDGYLNNLYRTKCHRFNREVPIDNADEALEHPSEEPSAYEVLENNDNIRWFLEEEIPKRALKAFKHTRGNAKRRVEFATNIALMRAKGASYEEIKTKLKTNKMRIGEALGRMGLTPGGRFV